MLRGGEGFAEGHSLSALLPRGGWSPRYTLIWPSFFKKRNYFLPVHLNPELCVFINLCTGSTWLDSRPGSTGKLLHLSEPQLAHGANRGMDRASSAPSWHRPPPTPCMFWSPIIFLISSSWENPPLGRSLVSAFRVSCLPPNLLLLLLSSLIPRTSGFAQ